MPLLCYLFLWQSFGLVSNNPVLRNITDYLIEEASAEEEELLGTNDAEDGQIEDTCAIERDENLIKVLDRLLLYLRIVYSVDYYNHCEYPQEDEMPNRYYYMRRNSAVDLRHNLWALDLRVCPGAVLFMLAVLRLRLKCPSRRYRTTANSSKRKSQHWWLPVRSLRSLNLGNSERRIRRSMLSFGRCELFHSLY